MPIAHRSYHTSAAIAFVCAMAGTTYGQVVYDFHELLPPPGTTVVGLAVTKVSGDGLWAIGHYTASYSPLTIVAVRWPLTGPAAFTAQQLINPSGWTNTMPTAVNDDGSIIFGGGRPSGQSIGSPFKWTGAGFSYPGGTGTPVDCDASGTLVLLDVGAGSGRVWNASTGTLVRALSQGFDVKAFDGDGNNVVGTLYDFPFDAAHETSGGELEQLCTLVGCGSANPFTSPSTGDVSDDGTTWAGVIRQSGSGYGGYDASLYFYRGGHLTTVPAPISVSNCDLDVQAVSVNGDMAVGYTNVCDPAAFVYDPRRGFRILRDELVLAGINLTGWQSLEIAVDVSHNGQVVVGSGFKGGTYSSPFVAIIPPACDPIDFNGDGLFPDVQDIADFLSIFAGGVCAGQQPGDTPCNGDIDFNNDALFPDAADIASLLRVFSGGSC